MNYTKALLLSFWTAAYTSFWWINAVLGNFLNTNTPYPGLLLLLVLTSVISVLLYSYILIEKVLNEK